MLEFFIHHPTPRQPTKLIMRQLLFLLKEIPTNFSEQIYIGGNFCDADCTIDCASFSGEL